MSKKDTKFGIKQFQFTSTDREEGFTVHYHVLIFQGALYIWLGDSDQSFNALTVAMPTPYVKIVSYAFLKNTS